MAEVRNPVSISLVYQPFGRLWWHYTPEFRIKGPFYTKAEAENALEKHLFAENLSVEEF